MAQNKKYLYAIKNLKIENWIKWWLLRKGSIPADYVLGELMTGTDITINNTVEKKFFKFDVKGNSVQTTRLLPDSYTQLEYIEGTGTQYINTNYTPVQGDNFELKYVRMSASNSPQAIMWAGTEGNQLILLFLSSSLYYRYFSIDGEAPSFVIGYINGNIKITDGKFYYNDELKMQSTYAGAINGTLQFFRRPSNDSSYANMRLGEVIITNNNVKKHHYVPCKRNSDNTVGFYDIVSNTFLTNAGTGTFNYGNLPTPNYEVPIYSAGDNGSISEKIVNKNKLDVNVIQERTTNGITMTFNGQTINLKGTATGNANFYMKTGKSIILPAGTYYIQRTSLLNIGTLKLTSGSTTILSTGNTDTTVTLNSETVIDGLTLQVSSSVGTIDKDVVLMICSSSLSTEYTPYQEQTYTIPCQQPMRSIGTVRDEFIKVNGNWYERHNLGIGNRNSFTGAINMGSTLASDLYGFACNNSLNISANSELGAVISNIFEAKVLGSATDTTNVNNARFNMGICKNTSSTQIVITLKKTYLSEQTQSALFNFLDSKEFYFYYQLATPTDLPCTLEQIAILENLPKSYNEQTNIYSLDVTPAYLEVQAYVKKEEVIENEGD